MNSLLPVLAEQSAPMVLCSICPKPGNCCSGFQLNSEGGTRSFWKNSWKEDAKEFAIGRGFPFEPSRITGTFFSEEHSEEYVTVSFSCPKVSEGRCTIYESRPELCRTYIPGTDGLCVMTKLMAVAA